MHEAPTRELVDSAVRGDDAALEELLVRYLPRLRAFVRLRCGAELRAQEESSDIAQSVCREVLGKIAALRWEGEPAFRSWLFGEALRKILDRAAHWRAAKRDVRREERDVADSQVWECYHESFTPSQNAIAREQAERIEAAIGALDEVQREVVVLAKIVGLSRAEIAEKLGKSEGAVRVILHRALAAVSDAC